MNTLEERLKRLGDRLDERCGPIAPDEVGEFADGQLEDDLIDYVPQPDANEEPDEITTLTPRKRRISVIATVAAAILLIAGIAVVADRNSDDVVTDSDTPASVADPVSPPDQTGFLQQTGVVDSLGYRWSRVPHDNALLDEDPAQEMNAVAVGGPGLVAVGSAGLDDGSRDAAVWTSVDGVAWSRVPHDEVVFGGAEMNGVAVGGPGLVAVGSTGRSDRGGDAGVWTSVDGIAWSRVPHDEVVFGGEWGSFCGGAVMNSVAVGGPGLVAVGAAVAQDGRRHVVVWTSADGTTWSRVPHDEEVFGHVVLDEEPESNGCYGPEMFSVTGGGPGIVAVGWAGSHQPVENHSGKAAVWTSVDGIAWSRVPHDEEVFGGPNDLRMLGVTYGGPGLVAVGYASGDAAVWTSVDGTIWSRVPHDEAVFGRPDVAAHNGMWMHSVAVSGRGLVAVGEGWLRNQAAIWTSVDGIAWSRAPHDEAVVGGAIMRDVTVGGPGLVAVGKRWSSEEGYTPVWVATPEN